MIGNWVLSEPSKFSSTSEGDAILGVAALLLLVGATLQVAGIIVSYRSRSSAD
jgi:hypothetical protein